MVLGTVPPVPVAAFGDKDFFKRQPALRLAGRRRCLSVKVAGVVKIVPGTIVFRRADPHVEIGVNPGAGNQRRELGEISVPGNSLGDGNRLDSRFTLQQIVETAQELTPRLCARVKTSSETLPSDGQTPWGRVPNTCWCKSSPRCSCSRASSGRRKRFCGRGRPGVETAPMLVSQTKGR